MENKYTVKEILDKAKTQGVTLVPFGGDEIKSPELEPDCLNDDVLDDECIDQTSGIS